jgi:hypothetical protein
VARANLSIEATKVGKIYYHEGVFRISGGQYNPGQLYKGLFADIANVPMSGKINAVSVRAVLTIQSRSYSPLPWLGEYTNTVTLEPAVRKSVLLAVGEDKQMGAWHFVLNHRNTYRDIPMDWTNLAPIPSDLPMQILFVDVNTGELVRKFDYLWTFDPSNSWPILKIPPESSSSR